jgi:hypothetical protein
VARAQLIDERPEEDNVDTAELEQAEQFEQEPQQEVTQQAEDDLPEKYRGKSVQDIVRMHQEAEKLLGKQSSEVGELRKVVDTYIQTQLSQQEAPKETEDDYDFYTDPEKAVSKAIENHPKIKEAEQYTQQYKRATALSQLQGKHPDMQNILQDDKFANWIKDSKIRTQLFVQADQQYDYEAADELFTLWKERQATVQQTAQVEKQNRKQAVKNANTGNARGNPDGSAKKVYRRADIIKLMRNDPDRYEQLSDEIMLAYQEGRVK